MRMSTEESRDEELALATIAAAAGAGVTVFDTAHSYGRGPDELGHNERLLARGIRASGVAATARVVTKGGMTRARGEWIPDGRAKALLSDCEASLAALDGLAIDLYLIHAPDPRTPWRTSLRALAKLVDAGLVRRVGLSNVNRHQLDQALELVPVSAVQVALSVFDDRAIRGGVVERCTEAGIAVIAHSPLGGPRRAGRLTRDEVLAGVAGRHGATAPEVALSWVLGLSPLVIAIPGARHPETVRSAVRAATLALSIEEASLLRRTRPPSPPKGPVHPHAPTGGEVVLVMGIPGAGKSRVAAQYIADGYLRLNRDERGGSLRDLAGALDERLAAGDRRLVLDNTYLTRAARSYVIETATRHELPTRCVWIDTPLAQAQVNIVERLLERFGSLPTPEALRGLARREPGLLAPASQMRALRELEPPSADEGFAAVERMPFARVPPAGAARVGVFVAASALQCPGWERALAKGSPMAPHLVFDWIPQAGPGALTEAVARLQAEVSGQVDAAVCVHAGGPPSCWCRPPLPGLPIAFARAHGVNPASSTLIGTGPAHRTLANTLGARYEEVK
jgi:aryl-alcohol dehydrogenase-like predicted oxidoreductase/predicted kinase